MRPFEKEMMRYLIVRRDKTQNYDFEQDYLSMDMSKICRLGDYAEIFGIKGTASGKSPQEIYGNNSREHTENS